MIIRPSPSLLRSSILPRQTQSLQSRCLLGSTNQRRTFILPTSSGPQRFTATRHLRHPPSKLFGLISDINSYSSFVPFCVASTVTARSPPPDQYPTQADLRVGWGGYDETFTSRVRCEKYGDTKDGGMVEADATENSIFEVLRARWVINDSKRTEVSKGEESKVDLEIEYKFANPLYAVMSEAVMPSVAGKIIEAFEGRVEQVLGKK